MYLHTRLTTSSPLNLGQALLLLTVFGAPSLAQEVEWRYDYNAARKEALEKNRPLAIDIGTENCFWCKKLELTTFRERDIVSTMNEHFIPLKVDAYRDNVLASALHVQSYPTLVLAAPDGKILGTFEGYQDAIRWRESLAGAAASVANPEWMTRDFQEAAKAVAGSEYARAIALLKAIINDGKERPVQVKSRELLGSLEDQANTRLARAKQLDDKGQTTEAIATLTGLLKDFAGTPAATDGSKLLTTLGAKPEVNDQVRKRRAAELLAQAREDYRNHQYLGCLERCEILGASYADLREGNEALELASEIKNNPEWLQRACDTLADRLGGLYLSLAETCIKKGQTQQAMACLERVVQTLPGSRQAELAQVRLANLQGRPTWQAEFQKH
jgi:thioredoxin-like negative regulator of GroEL